MKAQYIACACAAALCGVALADEKAAAPAEEPAAEETSGWAYNPGEGVSFNEHPIVSAEFSLAWDSKYLSYGLIDNPDPILTPAASITLLDWVTVGVSAIFDTTKYGKGAGYYNRAWDWTEVDPEIGIGHSFSPDDFEWLPTTVDLSVTYMYEYHTWSSTGPDAECVDENDPSTQFITVEAGLPDLWFEPVFQYERDLFRDEGTYLNLEIGHTFPIIDGESEEDDPILTLKPSIAQGWGDWRRVAGYLSHRNGEPLERAGLMDTWLKLTADWKICDLLSLSGYVAYSDYIFDRHTREGAYRYEATGKYDDSFNFTCGLALTATF